MVVGRLRGAGAQHARPVAGQRGDRPTLQSALASPAIRDNPVLQLAIEQAKYSIPMPVDSRLRFIWDGIREPYRRVFTDNLSPDEAARLMQREAERRITEGRL
jgi:maltose-binding protein MalE